MKKLLCLFLLLISFTCFSQEIKQQEEWYGRIKSIAVSMNGICKLELDMTLPNKTIVVLLPKKLDTYFVGQNIYMKNNKVFINYIPAKLK